jgi:hypothetical protein
MSALYAASHPMTRAVHDLDGRRPVLTVLKVLKVLVAGRAAVVPAVEGSLQGGGGVLAVGLTRTGRVADAAGGLSGHGDRLLEITEISKAPEGRGAVPQGLPAKVHWLTAAIRWIERDVRLLQS